MITFQARTDEPPVSSAGTSRKLPRNQVSSFCSCLASSPNSKCTAGSTDSGAADNIRPCTRKPGFNSATYSRLWLYHSSRQYHKDDALWKASAYEIRTEQNLIHHHYFLFGSCMLSARCHLCQLSPRLHSYWSASARWTFEILQGSMARTHKMHQARPKSGQGVSAQGGWEAALFS